MIRGFSFALLIGILVGTYSSLFVSSNVVVELSNAEKPSK
jgi:preprotein translocase subunit SecF